MGTENFHPAGSIEDSAGSREPGAGLASSLAIVAGPWILAFVFAAAGFAKAESRADR